MSPIRIIIAGTIIALALGGLFILRPMLEVASGYAAKMACSSVFVSGRSLEDVLSRELSGYSYLSTEINEADRLAQSSFGPITSVAVYRPSLGCVLVKGRTQEELQAESIAQPPMEETLIRIEMRPNLQQAIEDYVARESLRTRAVIVSRNNAILAEAYGDGFTSDMPHQGWSMTKSMIHALAGILVASGQLDPDAAAPVAEWQDEIDPRNAITVRHLLTMTDGLDFSERYSPPSDVTTMLFNHPAAGTYTAHRPLAHTPGDHWYYSSGTTNILSRIIGEIALKNGEHPAAFARRTLFAPLGMESAIIETDASGHLVGSSFGFATARDWLRFGLLYFNNGIVGGQRMLPDGWVYDARTPTAGSEGMYGQHWWLNDPERKFSPREAGLPADAYMAAGFEAQYVIIIPSQRMVIVRLGYTPDEDSADISGLANVIFTALDNERPL